MGVLLYMCDSPIRSLHGTATKRSITYRKRHLMWLLLNVAAHNVEVTKCKSYKTEASHNTYYCDVLTFFDIYVLELLRFETLTFRNYDV